MPSLPASGHPGYKYGILAGCLMLTLLQAQGQLRVSPELVAAGIEVRDSLHPESSGVWIFWLENTADEPVPVYGDFPWLLDFTLTSTAGDSMVGGYAYGHAWHLPAEELYTLQWAVPARTVCQYRITVSSPLRPGYHLRLSLYDRVGLYQEVYQEAYTRRAYLMFLILTLSVIGFQVFFSLILWLLSREIHFLFYGAYILIFALIQYLLYAGYIFLPTPGWPPHAVILYWIPHLYFGAYYCYLRFVMTFLRLPELAPAEARQVVWLLRLTLGYLLIQAVLYAWRPASSVLYVGYSVFFFGVIVRLIFRLFRFKDLIIRLVLIGSAVFGVGAFANLMLALVLRIYPELDWDNPYNLTTISMLIELVFFSAAIAYKFRQDEREKQAAQAELIRRLEENQVLAQHLQDIRNRIARDLHDDIGGTLSSISIYTEVARRQLEPTSPIREILDKIARQAVEMVGQMSDTIWTLHPRNDHTGSLIRRMEDVAASLLGAASVQYTFDVSPEAMAAPLSMDQRKNLFLIYKEAVNNVVRHAHATRVTIQAGCEAGHWYLEVADNGTGTQPAPDHTGHGLQNMQVRAQEIGGMLTLTPGPGAGTQIRITVPLPVLGDMSRRPG